MLLPRRAVCARSEYSSKHPYKLEGAKSKLFEMHTSSRYRPAQVHYRQAQAYCRPAQVHYKQCTTNRPRSHTDRPRSNTDRIQTGPGALQSSPGGILDRMYLPLATISYHDRYWTECTWHLLLYHTLLDRMYLPLATISYHDSMIDTCISTWLSAPKLYVWCLSLCRSALSKMASDTSSHLCMGPEFVLKCS